MMSKTFWVIETARTTYWDGHEVKDKAYFTENIDEAIKFYDFESAEIVRLWLVENSTARLRSTEHSYINKEPN